MVTKRHDEGFSLIEVLLVISRCCSSSWSWACWPPWWSRRWAGSPAKPKTPGAGPTPRILATAAEAYFPQHATQVIPAVDSTHDAYEKSLGDSGFLRASFEFHDLDVAGHPVAARGSPCTV